MKKNNKVYWIKVIMLEDKDNNFKEKSWLEKVESKNVLKFYKERIEHYKEESKFDGSFRLDLMLFGKKVLKSELIEGYWCNYGI